ncbi:monofunctional biosynthetic peptidoglycan transglycosylase [Pseudaeromonas paramecii]|uniref:Biosynthetic peptidoglycan transglycosylase n=1 Tax=Pseudaeromonas paramecii TaxID=2138166 RepID=A0ABP8PX42_9GAMM
MRFLHYLLHELPRAWRRASWPVRLRRVLLGLLLLWLLWLSWVFVQLCWYRSHAPGSTAFMQEQLSVLQETQPKARLRQQWLPYGQIDRDLKRALLVAEDSGFMDHHGFDWEGIQVAWRKNLAKGRIVAGGSTISQQLAKNLFLSSARTPWRKLNETLITLMLEAVLSKQRILEIYLNVIEWGQGVFGAEAAARHYFGRSARSLSASQAAYLAAMVTRPRYYEQHRHHAALLRKQRILLARLYQVRIP